MELISPKRHFDFVGKRYFFAGLSLLAFLASIWVWFDSGEKKYGVDFLGGTEVVVRFDSAVDISDVRKALGAAGLKSAIVQAFKGGANEFSIRLKKATGTTQGQKVRKVLEEMGGPSFKLLKQDFVGPTIGEELRKDGLTAVVIALIGMLIYISIRFELRFAIGALVALVHDVVITAGVFVLSGHEISAAVLAGLLTIVGYSLNDTIIVFDRIRENMTKALKTGGAAKKQKVPTEFPPLVNTSINQTLQRTILTSLTTLFVVVCLWQIGGGAVVELAYTLVIGVIVGTYSSIFVASPVVIALHKGHVQAGKEA